MLVLHIHLVWDSKFLRLNLLKDSIPHITIIKVPISRNVILRRVRSIFFLVNIFQIISGFNPVFTL